MTAGTVRGGVLRSWFDSFVCSSEGVLVFFVAPFLFFRGEHAFPTQFVAESFEGEERWMSRKLFSSSYFVHERIKPPLRGREAERFV